MSEHEGALAGKGLCWCSRERCFEPLPRAPGCFQPRARLCTGALLLSEPRPPRICTELQAAAALPSPFRQWAFPVRPFAGPQRKIFSSALRGEHAEMEL